MAQQNIDFGTFPDDPSADAIRTAFSKVQTNFDQLFSTNANSTVNSINRTPGAGVTVNYPTGNVVISANIACLLVATTSLRVGRGADNTLSNVTITSSSQQLNIDIDPAQVLSNTFAAPGSGLANLNGTLTSNSYYQPNINTVGTLTSLTVTGNVSVAGNASFTSNANFTGANINFSNISNLHIQGGTLGYYLQTDGVGGLSWAAGGGGGNGSPGGVNTYVQFNDEGNFGANLGFTFDKLTGILTVPSLAVTNSATIGNLVGSLANGNSNVNIPVANGNVNISSGGNANVFVVTSTGANILGNLTVGNADLGNLATVNYLTGTLTTNAQPNITSVGTLTSLNVANAGVGNITADNANLGNLTTSNYFAGTLTTAAQPNITSTGTLTSLSVTGNIDSGNLNIANNAIITGNLSVLGNATYVNIESLVIEDPIISLGGGPNGDPLVANTGKDVGTALQYFTTVPVTAFMGWDLSNAEFSFGSNVSISAGEVVTFTNLGNVRASYFIGDNTQFGNANLGNTATANFFVGRFHGLANSATVANTVVDNAQPNITSVGTLTSLAVTGNTTSGNFVGKLANGNSNISITADSNINLTSTGNTTVVVTGTGINATGTGNFSGNLSAANILGPLSNGNSNVNIPSANGNINLTSVGNTTLVVTGTGANITGTLSASGNANAGNFGTGQVLATANITAPQLISNIATGTAPLVVTSTTQVANLSVATAGSATTAGTVTTAAQGNITSVGTLTSLGVGGTVTASAFTANTGVFTGNGSALSALVGGNVSGQVGNALVAGTVYTAAQGNITSVGTLTSLSVSGNITSGNISATNHTGTTANLTGQYITTIATGTAPFVVTSTTQVANLNVASAGLATYATTANAVAGANVSGQVGNALVAGTVYTAAQPNITSVGTLSSLSSSGNITGANLIVTNYHIRSVGTGIIAAGTTQGGGTTLTKEINIVSTVSSGSTGVVLPTAVAGMIVTVTNTTANSMIVYPATGGQINSLGTNAGFTQGTTTIQFVAPTTTQWYTVGATYA